MKRIHLNLLLLAVLCVVVNGCGPKKPADFPEIYPFTVKVVDGETPIEGVQVYFLYDKNPIVAGKTDAKGIATISTTVQKYTENGAPAGEYRVQCTKDPLAEHWKTPEEQSQMSKPERDAYLNEWIDKCSELPREIPKIWGDFDKTPLTATVSTGGGEVTFDVEGKAND